MINVIGFQDMTYTDPISTRAVVQTGLITVSVKYHVTASAENGWNMNTCHVQSNARLKCSATEDEDVMKMTVAALQSISSE